MSHLRHYSEHYAVLGLLLAIGLGCLVYFRYNPQVQHIVLWATISGYVLWGMGHHLLRKDLTVLIVLEYFLVAFIGGLIIQATLLQR